MRICVWNGREHWFGGMQCMGSSWNTILAVSIQTVQRDFPVFISGHLRLLERFLLCQFTPRDPLNTLWIRHSILIRSEGKQKKITAFISVPVPCRYCAVLGPASSGSEVPVQPGRMPAAPRDALSACASSGGKNTAGETRRERQSASKTKAWNPFHSPCCWYKNTPRQFAASTTVTPRLGRVSPGRLLVFPFPSLCFYINSAN